MSVQSRYTIPVRARSGTRVIPRARPAHAAAARRRPPLRDSPGPARSADTPPGAARSAARVPAREDAPVHGAGRSRRRTRACPGAGARGGCCLRRVHEPQRVFWLVTQRTDLGRARPSKYCADSRSARSASSASPSTRLLSWAASLSSMTLTQRCSSASDIRAGISTTVRSPSRYAETVRRRRALLRTSIAVAAEPLGGWLVVLRCGVPARCSGSADTPRRYPLYMAEVPTPGRFGSDPPPCAGFVRRIPPPVDNFRHGPSRPGMLALAAGATADHRERSARRTGLFHEGYGGLVMRSKISPVAASSVSSIPTSSISSVPASSVSPVPASSVSPVPASKGAPGRAAESPAVPQAGPPLVRIPVVPLLKPALRRGWRDLNTVQLGMTPAHAMTLGPMDGDGQLPRPAQRHPRSGAVA